MLSHFTLASILLFALSAPSDGRPLNTTSPFINATIEATAQSGNTVYSETWAGAELIPALQNDEGFVSVAGTFSVSAIISGEPGSVATVWVGMGSGCFPCSVIIRAGVWMAIRSDGSSHYQAWYQWHPGPRFFINVGDLPVNYGDLITVTLIRLDSQAAAVTIQNYSVNKQYTTKLISFDTTLLLTSAAWILDRRPEPFPFPDFQGVTFSDAVAITNTLRRMPANSEETTLFSLRTRNGRDLTDVWTSDFLGPAVHIRRLY